MGDVSGAATDGMADGGTAAPVMGTDGGDANGATSGKGRRILGSKACSTCGAAGASTICPRVGL